MRVRVRVVPQVEEPRLIRAVLEPAAIKPVPKPLVGPGDNDNDDPGEDRASMIFGPRTPRERSTRVDTEERLDPIKGFALMKQALVELVQVRRRYSHLTDLRFVFDAIDELVRRAFAGQRSQVAIAADLARAMMDRDGLDLYTASERAAAAYNVTTTEVREAVRARRVG